VKLSTYPAFRLKCTVGIILPGNTSCKPDITLVVSLFVNHWNDIQSGAMREAVYRLELLGVDKDTLKNAEFEVDDCSYVALEPRGVRREYGVPVEAFYHHDPKKRDVLIRQRRLVPDSQAEMVELYGKPVVVAVNAEAVPA